MVKYFQKVNAFLALASERRDELDNGIQFAEGFLTNMGPQLGCSCLNRPFDLDLGVCAPPSTVPVLLTYIRRRLHIRRRAADGNDDVSSHIVVRRQRKRPPRHARLQREHTPAASCPIDKKTSVDVRQARRTVRIFAVHSPRAQSVLSPYSRRNLPELSRSSFPLFHVFCKSACNVRTVYRTHGETSCTSILRPNWSFGLTI